MVPLIRSRRAGQVVYGEAMKNFPKAEAKGS